LAAVFEVPLSDLQEENAMKEQKVSAEEEEALNYVRELRGFYSHLIKYLVIVGFLFVLNILTNPDYIWAKWVALGWGLGVCSHAMGVFEIGNFFGAGWEKKQVEKRLKRKL
jgi:hypothetical protein